MSQRRSKLEISGKFLHCPLFLCIDTYEGCSFGCRYCFANPQHDRQSRGIQQRKGIRSALLTRWEKVLEGKNIGNPMIEYLVRKRHPIQLGASADPFPRGIEKKVQNTRRFLAVCNSVKYPVYITTKNTDELPIDLLATGNYVLGVSLASHRAGDIKLLERNTSSPRDRLARIPQEVFKKVIIRWQPFIPNLYRSKRKGQIFDLGEIERYLDLTASVADGVSVSYLTWTGIRDPLALQAVGADDVDDQDALELFTFMQEQAHRRGLEFYTANFRALSDLRVCCGLNETDFPIATQWVWAYLIIEVVRSARQEYLTVDDLRKAFPARVERCDLRQHGRCALLALGTLPCRRRPPF